MSGSASASWSTQPWVRPTSAEVREMRRASRRTQRRADPRPETRGEQQHEQHEVAENGEGGLWPPPFLEREPPLPDDEDA